MPTSTARRAAAVALLGTLAACGSSGAAVRPPPDPASAAAEPIVPLADPHLPADSTVTVSIAHGVRRLSFFVAPHPWAIHVLDVDRSRCWEPAAVKAGGGAVGRERTSTLVAALSGTPGRERAVGGVNADFFLFAPPGVPRGAHIERGVVIAGPSPRPLLALDSAGGVHLTMVHASGTLVAGPDTFPIASWNRPTPDGLAYFDAGWGARTDTASGVLRLTTARRDGGPVTALDTGLGPAVIPREGAVLVLGGDAAASLRGRLLRLRPSLDSVRAAVRLEPFHPREAVGGSHVLLRDGQVVQGLDTAGGPRFGPFRHPRTAVGIGAGGRRLLLVVVDGRQREHSAGMTLRELAETLRDLGAEEAINLDGGGSSALAVRSAGDTVLVVSRPSDAAGERAVANALAVVRGACAPRAEPAPTSGRSGY